MFRRASAWAETKKKYGQQLGIEVAKTIMNHHEGRDVFRKHYSRATNNMALRLGEIQGDKETRPGEALERDRNLT